MTNATGTPILVAPQTSTPLPRATGLPERWLQELIHNHPASLPMDQIEPGIGHLIPVCMELPLAVGAVDNLFITPEGNLVVAEVKLWGNPEARRKVVAQALEYATALFKLDYTGLENAVMKADFNGADRPESLYSLVDGADAPPESVFADRVTRNLREGRIVVLIVGDEIRPQADEFRHRAPSPRELPLHVRPGRNARVLAQWIGFPTTSNIVCATHPREDRHCTQVHHTRRGWGHRGQRCRH